MAPNNTALPPSPPAPPAPPVVFVEAPPAPNNTALPPSPPAPPAPPVVFVEAPPAPNNTALVHPTGWLPDAQPVRTTRAGASDVVRPVHPTGWLPDAQPVRTTRAGASDVVRPVHPTGWLVLAAPAPGTAAMAGRAPSPEWPREPVVLAAPAPGTAAMAGRAPSPEWPREPVVLAAPAPAHLEVRFTASLVTSSTWVRWSSVNGPCAPRSPLHGLVGDLFDLGALVVGQRTLRTSKSAACRPAGFCASQTSQGASQGSQHSPSRRVSPRRFLCKSDVPRSESRQSTLPVPPRVAPPVLPHDRSAHPIVAFPPAERLFRSGCSLFAA